jgi:hypothetical protein
VAGTTFQNGADEDLVKVEKRTRMIMGNKITNCAIATGYLEGHDFAPAGHQGDWLSFEAQFTTGPRPVFHDSPRVIVTPIFEDPIDIGAFPVCVVREISTTGFTMAARNSARHGFAAFAWVAILETPGIVQQVPDVRTGIVPALHFGANGTPQAEAATASLPELDTSAAVVMLTPTDPNVHGHSIAAVGALGNRFEDAVGQPRHLSGYNPDLVSGGCAFNWAQFPVQEFFQPGRLTQHVVRDDHGVPIRIDEVIVPEVFVETGEVAAAHFEPSGQRGDWQTWNVHFKDAFTAPPTVLLTAKKSGDTRPEANPAVVGVVQAVIAHGFRLAARNSDCSGGETGFEWVAFGFPA